MNRKKYYYLWGVRRFVKIECLTDGYIMNQIVYHAENFTLKQIIHGTISLKILLQEYKRRNLYSPEAEILLRKITYERDFRTTKGDS